MLLSVRPDDPDFSETPDGDAGVPPRPGEPEDPTSEQPAAEPDEAPAPGEVTEVPPAALPTPQPEPPPAPDPLLVGPTPEEPPIEHPVEPEGPRFGEPSSEIEAPSAAEPGAEAAPPRAPTAPSAVPSEAERVAVAPPAEPPPSPAEPASERRPFLQRAALAALIIAAAALIGYVLSQPDEEPTGAADALVRSVEAAGQLRLVVQTDAPSEARQFIRDEFGWRVGVPVLDGTELQGVAIARAAAAVEVPVFLYADDEARNVAVFAYSYALLDQVPDRLRLSSADYDDLDDGAPVIRDARGNDVLLWRDRDDIYVAVTDLPPEDLVERLSMVR